MNGFGRLAKEDIDTVGEFFADHFTRPVQGKDVKDEQLYRYIFYNE